MTHVVVVGGGIAGLSTAFFLREGGYGDRLTVLEREPRWGGKINTELVGDFILESGAESLLSQKPWALQLARKLGLEDRLQDTRAENSGVFIWSRGRLQAVPEGFTLMVPTRVWPVLRSGLISPWGKLRMGLDLFIPRRTGTNDESLGAFVRRRLGAEVLEKIAEPMMAGIYAADADRLSIQCTFPRFVEMERQHGSLVRAALVQKAAAPAGGRTPFVSFTGGLQDLLGTLEGHLRARGVELRAGTSVDTLEVQQLRLEDGTTVAADAIVLATPAFAAARMVENLDPELSAHLQRLPYESSAILNVAWPRAQVGHPLKGFGLVVPRQERRTLLACTWTSSKWSGRAPQGTVLLRAYMAGSETVAKTDDVLKREVIDELKCMLDIRGEPELQELRRIDRGTPHYLVGHLDWVAAAEALAARHAGLFLTGSAYRGIGISDCVREAERTAQAVLAPLSLGNQATMVRTTLAD